MTICENCKGDTPCIECQREIDAGNVELTVGERKAIDAALLSIKTVTQHAVEFKRMFHEMQEEAWAWQDKCIAERATVKRQREIIRKLEIQLGIDQEL